jgi:rare lipoprotein A
MYLKSKPDKYRVAIRVLQLLIFCIISFSTSVIAQKNTAANKAKPKKTVRILYGQASFYANKFNGRRTASGEIFDQKKLTCACNVLPLGTWIKVTNLKNKHSVIVKINDRIHPKMKRIVDLTRAAAHKLGYISNGLARVKVELVERKLIPD